MRTGVLFGADPEIFLVDENNEIVSASEIIDGEIKSYHGSKEVGSIINDGMQIELHPKPASCRQIFSENLFFILKQTESITSSKKLNLFNGSTINVSKKKLDSLPLRIRELGCEPDKLAYTGSVKILNIDGSKHFKRYCGGHIHFGLSEENSKNLIKREIHDNANEIIMLMDYILGNTFVLLDDDLSNKERRLVYGQAGSYRIQNHGIEYRTLSNYWLRHPVITSLALRLGRIAIHNAEPSSFAPKIINDLKTKIPEKMLIDSINSNDKNTSLHIFKVVVKTLFKSTIENFNISEWAFIQYLSLNRLKKELIDKNSISKNWNLNGHRDGRGWESFVNDEINKLERHELIELYRIMNYLSN